MNDIDGRPQWEIHFDDEGGIAAGDDAIATIIDEVRAAGVTELVTFSHGWNNDERSARSLYAAMFPLIGRAAGRRAPELAAGIGYLGVFWPSIWFPDEARAQAAARAGGRSDALALTDRSQPLPLGARTGAMSGRELVEAVEGAFPASARADLVRLGRLIDEGIAAAEGDEQDLHEQERLDEFSALLARAAGAGPRNEEDRGESAAVRAREGERVRTAYDILATTMGGGPPTRGDAQGLGQDILKIWHGAKEAVRVASFFQMKARAGDVGTRGLGAFLTALAGAAPEVHAHLVGHSFGGRLVSFSLTAIEDPATTPVRSLTLIQAAFSHWSFADEQPWGHRGALHSFVDRVRGPLVATFSAHDRAVGDWYPAASVLSGSDSQAVMVDNEHWGGLGSDGFRRMPVSDAPVPMKELDDDYDLTAGGFCSVDGSRIIRRPLSAFSGAHSDIGHPQVAWVVVAAAEAGAASG